jgi:hypothetical protein
VDSDIRQDDGHLHLGSRVAVDVGNRRLNHHRALTTIHELLSSSM